MRMFRLDWMIPRLLAGVIATSVGSALIMGILMLSPQPVPPLKAQVQRQAQNQSGVVQTHYFAGLLKEEWSYVDGIPHGLTRQYYPNASLFREINYDFGLLDGPYSEYYEKSTRHGGGRRTQGLRAMGQGELKAKGYYSRGKRDGPLVMYYPSGILKEEREYRDGQKTGTWRRYHKDGRLKKEKTYNSL